MNTQNKKDPFLDDEIIVFKTSEGDVDVPLIFYDLSSVICLFYVNYDLARKKFQGTGLIPCRLYNGKAAITVSFYDYKKSSIGGYHEAALTTLTYAEGTKQPFFTQAETFKKADKWRVGAYIHDLPVTSTLAKACGREIWGMPKFMADISFQLSKNRFRGSIDDPNNGENICTLEGRIGPFGLGRKIKGLDNCDYTDFNNDLFRLPIFYDSTSRCNFNMLFLGGMRLKVGRSDRIMAKNLRDLGLDNASPAMTFTTYTGRAKVGMGMPLREYNARMI